MIRICIPGFHDNDTGGPRWGDAQIIDDGKNFEVIDGYCEIGATRLIKYLKARGIKTPYLHISHAHYDHYDGIRQIIRDSYFKPKGLFCYDPATLGDVSADVKDGKRVLKNIITEAKNKGIPVTYLKQGDKITHGDIKIHVYRNTSVTYRGNDDAYMNDSSLSYWFPEIGYLTTGDADFDCANKYRLHPVMIKIGHHGNDCSGHDKQPRAMATWLYQQGCRYCWDNDYNTKITDFLQTGREDCTAVGMKYFSCHGDINILAYGGKVVIYKDGKTYSYKCSYKGKSTIGYATITVIEDVIAGKYGASNERVTTLLNAGYWPSNVQAHINKLYKLIKG